MHHVRDAMGAVVITRVESVAEEINDTYLPGSKMNITEDERDEQLAMIEIGTLAAIFIATMVGNGALLLALFAKKHWTNRSRIPRMHFFMLHLCIADLVTAWLNVLPQLAWEVTYRFNGEDILCKAVKFGQTLGPYLSSYVLTVTALDRYKAICQPLTYCSWSSRRANTLIATAWGASLMFCLPQVIVFSYQEVMPGVYDCWAVFSVVHGERLYVTWYCISVFLVPLTVLVYTYTCICICIWKSTGPVSASAPHKVVSRAKINTIKQTIAVIAIYILCSSPFISAQLWAVWDPNAMSSPFLSGATFTILTLLSSLNSCVNPWIYLFSNQDLMEALWRLGCKREPERSANSVGSGGSSTRPPQQTCLLNEAHTHLARWVISIPPDTSETERTALRLFRAPYRERSKVVYEHPCRAVRLSPDL